MYMLSIKIIYIYRKNQSVHSWRNYMCYCPEVFLPKFLGLQQIHTTQLRHKESLLLRLTCQTVKSAESKGKGTLVSNNVKYEVAWNHFLGHTEGKIPETVSFMAFGGFFIFLCSPLPVSQQLLQHFLPNAFLPQGTQEWQQLLGQCRTWTASGIAGITSSGRHLTLGKERERRMLQ